ncbi:hypothetical protein B0T18DRAFT_417665 [Schizothecium vesticola]|uniref:Uncharacterized protein n=1 Tax=Schizothecium vesticola TaxID=314040 RepID=A0AA40EJ60_9PEZI|nr:hypothetical protein B0T18DRAFT_417665 [Schizothecium vesticola]
MRGRGRGPRSRRGCRRAPQPKRSASQCIPLKQERETGEQGNRGTGPSGTEPRIEPLPSRTWSPGLPRNAKGDLESPSSSPINHAARHRRLAERPRARRPRWMVHYQMPPRAVPARDVVAGESGPCPPRTVRDPRADRLFIDGTHRTPSGSCPPIHAISQASSDKRAMRSTHGPHGGSAGAQREAWGLGCSPNIQNDPSNGDDGSERGLSSTPLTPLLLEISLAVRRAPSRPAGLRCGGGGVVFLLFSCAHEMSRG